VSRQVTCPCRRWCRLFAEVELAVVESSDTSISGVTDEEPHVWSAAARDAPADTRPPAQQQLKPAQLIPALSDQHGSVSSRPLPQIAHGAAVNGHQGELGDSAVPSPALAAALRAGRTASQRSDPLPPGEKDQPESSLQPMPVAVRICSIVSKSVPLSSIIR